MNINIFRILEGSFSLKKETNIYRFNRREGIRRLLPVEDMLIYNMDISSEGTTLELSESRRIVIGRESGRKGVRLYVGAHVNEKDFRGTSAYVPLSVVGRRLV